MKILMLLDRFFPSDIRVEKEGRTLLGAGHEVVLLCIGKEHMPNEELIDSIRVTRKKLPQGFPTLPRRAWNSFWFQVFLVYPFWRQALENAVKQHKIEALHIHDLPLVKSGLPVARKFGVPLIADLHENYPEAIKAYPTSWKGKSVKPLIVKRWKKMEKSSVAQADRVITVVDEAKQHYVSDCGVSPEKITVVMNTEDLDYFYSLPIKQEIVKKYESHFVISYVGGFGHHRGIQTAILAMPKILSEIPSARLILVGSGANEAELKELAKAEKVEQAVEFTGWQPFDLVPSYIVASKICLIPHIASGHTNSTIPHKLFQYMAMGKPAVVSSARPLERIVNETGAGLVYPSGDTQALAEAVITIYRDGDLATNLGRAGKKAVKTKYNWKAEGEKLVKLYRELPGGIK